MKNGHQLSREKHLDHMVRVVPFIVGAYLLQCYMVMQIGGSSVARNGIFFLGAALALMILSFIVYDLTHRVTLYDNFLKIEVKWLHFEKIISYQEIKEIKVSDPDQTFSQLRIQTHKDQKITFYFIDEADKIKKWIEDQNKESFSQAA
jgi:hypothetical protein